MQGRGSSARFGRTAIVSRISTLALSMAATFASLYVAGRLWQDGQNRVYMAKELDRITGQGKSVVSVDDSWKILECRQQLKKLASLEMDLEASRQGGFVPKHYSEVAKTGSRRKLRIVIGILTEFSHKSKRDAMRKSWMGTVETLGVASKRMEDEKGVVVRFFIGRSADRGGSSDRSIENENKETNDIFILENHVEASEEPSKKTKLFFAEAVEKWDADYYAKLNDDVYVNIDSLKNVLTAHLNEPRVYIGCMKSGEVFSEPSQKWYEPSWWKFGDGKSYFRHASGEMVVISHALAKYISINRLVLGTYAHDDVSIGSWFIGLDAKHVDERKFCCSSSWSS
ncbi:hypothetical protein M569_10732, partial [Genlisea aurea]